MAYIPNSMNEGLFSSLKKLAGTFLAIVQTRLELLGTDLEEGYERLISLLATVFIALFCLCFGFVMLSILIVVLFWDTHRLLVLLMLTVLFLGAGGVLGIMALNALKAMPKMFAASLAELSKDQQKIVKD